ncbi:hypothetical protein S40285_06146 [Stachybotrys chlorohalonatus IBT 40285]|uniref:LIM zinc-binding domain-containing protein n=1 Tax=Stachybotrys chlorohalonatus (strain IBT 40285) TaxID=1283841 RepID=A0A084QL32_STAC4|nr:hypothetical protein S40285_06146 [Stachybotrys chlorohalonata IBT 40285]
MRAMGRPGDGKSRKVTPPSPTYMNNDQFAKYLSDLRTNRVARPGGARPQPAGARPAPARSGTSRHSLDAPSQAESLPSSQPDVSRASSPTKYGSISSRYSMSSIQGRDYGTTSPAAPLKPSDVVPSATYMERGHRWMEKEEAHSLRDAMEAMHVRDTPQPTPDEDETRLYNAALDEAAELVWKHQNGAPPPQPDGPYRYRPHLRQNSYAHARTATVNSRGRDVTSRSVSGSSSDSDGVSHKSHPSTDTKILSGESKRNQKPYGSVGARPSPFSETRRRSSMKRNISGEIQRPFSGDQIWEEPEATAANDRVQRQTDAPVDKLSTTTQNPLNRLRSGPSNGGLAKPLERIEIHRNPPTRSRNPQYTVNAAAEAVAAEEAVEKKNGVEIRSQDIREATSMRLKDRSPKLPEPTAVSDSPGRPIVSFDANWKAPDDATDDNPDRSATRGSAGAVRQAVEIPCIVVAEDTSAAPRTSSGAALPTFSVTEPKEATNAPIPTINVPAICVDEPTPSVPGVPTIVAPDQQPARSARPLPSPGAKGSRPLRAQRPRGHWSPAPGANARATALCHECGFPIEGRFVALAGVSERFHPQCFSCYTCGTGLEAMEISPEPQQMRSDRLDRIRRRQAGEILEEKPGMTAAEDGDDRMRFFCHLDWHELFAPRCKHCATPIIGEHIVALGEHWHYGHFFCAECGDPFEHGMTHIEKDGYAWCINCQTKRTERRAPKCKKCRTAVIGQYVQALGGEWHEHCFRCAECRGSFEDGQIFPKQLPEGLVVLCTGCRMKELKS